MTGSGATFDADEAAIAKLLAEAPAMSALEEVGNALVFALREASPKESGRLSRSWSARRAADGNVYVGTRSSYWHLPQYGTAGRPPQRYIDRAMSRTGVPYRPTGKEG